VKVRRLVTGLGWPAQSSGHWASWLTWSTTAVGLLSSVGCVDERTAVLTVDADTQALEDQRPLLTDAARRSRLSAPDLTDKRYPRLVHLLA
jgi:hypothetical protein